MRGLLALLAAVACAQTPIPGLYNDYPAGTKGTLSVHVLAQEQNDADLRQSMREGRYYLAHDSVADPTGFSLHATNNLGVFDVGDSVPLVGTTRLIGQSPREARWRVMRDGNVIDERTAARLDLAIKEPGEYRAEVRLPGPTGVTEPWIYSGAIQASVLDASSVRLPSSDIAPGVEVHKDIAYRDGGDPKHKLDLYLPKDRKGFPVMFFIHGGAWRTGDRARYTAVGNRFAKDGIGVVAISYRLSPQVQHPAHVEDAAAAFAWTARNIEKYGGRRDAIYVAGHSAGGHLAALLTLDPRYLKAHDLSARDIRGVVAMSGVYEIRGLERAFGSDPEVLRQASPMTHVKAPAPPFVVTYCQWDYLTLPLQARRFHAALKAAGVESRLVYVPKQSHISEMVNIVQPDDETARAILAFVK